MVPINLDYDPDFLKEEVRDGYTVSEEMKKLWLVELDILNKFIQVCDKYGLTYFADAGTLLGAVRHKGFVPWDDDIDVIMLRDDYDKFLEVAKTEFEYPYFVSNVFTTYESSFTTRLRRLDTAISGAPLSKERKQTIYTPMGIGIDLFCADNFPDMLKDMVTFQKSMEIANRKFLTTSKMFKAFYYRGVKFPERFNKCKNELAKSINNYNTLCKKYDDVDTKYIFNISFPEQPMDSFKRRFKEDYEKEVYIPFEMLTLRCPAGYERCLDIMYTQRNGVPWTEPVQNFAFHNQVHKKYYDFDNSYINYMKYFYNRPEDLIIPE